LLTAPAKPRSLLPIGRQCSPTRQRQPAPHRDRAGREIRAEDIPPDLGGVPAGIPRIMMDGEAFALGRAGIGRGNAAVAGSGRARGRTHIDPGALRKADRLEAGCGQVLGWGAIR